MNAPKPSFFAELQRRHVYKVGAMYCVAGWLLVQIVTQVLPVFDVSALGQRILVLVVVAGFPVALVLAWLFDITPAGIVRTPEAPAAGESPAAVRQRHGVDRKLNYLLGALLVLALGYLVLERTVLRERGTVVATNDKSIAVLPFENLSDDKANAYFASGIQDEILTRLAAIGSLKVISRTSTQHYASSPDNLPQIARELGVSNILEGSVQKAGDSVHINVQLIRAGTDEHLWAESYNRKLDDIFGVEGEVAQTIAERMNAALSGGDRQVLAAVPTRDIEAYDLYLRGLAWFNRADDDYAVSAEALPQAIKLFQAAFDKDPGFALAAAMLGRSHMSMYWFGPDRSDQRLAAARAAAEQALALQPDLGEAHYALALYHYWGFHDYAAAQAQMDLARRTMPNDASIELTDAAIARRQGKLEQATAGFQHTVTLSPRTSAPLFNLAQVYMQQHRYAEADQTFEHAAERTDDPESQIVRRAWNRILWSGDLAPMRSAAAALKPGTPAYSGNRVRLFDFAWLSRDYAAAAKVAEADLDGKWGDDANMVVPARLCLAWAYEANGQTDQARALYTRLHSELQAAVRERPGEADRHMALGFAAAGLGLKDEAAAEGRKAVQLLPVSLDAFTGPGLQRRLAQLYMRIGEPEQALPVLQQLMAMPAGHVLSAGILRLDPLYDSLRQDPRFLKLAAETAS